LPSAPQKPNRNFGRLTSDDATNNRFTIHGYIPTAIKHGLGAMAVIRNEARGSPVIWL
jgi:hypothetical protein